MKQPLLRPSGGLLYHARAVTRSRRWAGFRNELAAWLTSWNPPTEELLLVGPSAGYTLPDEWLRQFKKVTAFDVDPLAPFLFRRRHTHTTCEFLTQDLFWWDTHLSIKPLINALNQRPQATILFANILGQLPLEGPVNEAQWRYFLTELKSALNNRHWASYHDLFTIEQLALAHHTPVLEAFRANGDIAASLSERASSKVRVTDHLTGSPDWKTGAVVRYLPWSFSKNCLHIVEAVSSAPSP